MAAPVEIEHDLAMTRRSSLIVDDHQAFRTAARDLLDGRSFAVVGEAAGGREALAATARLRPNVVLVDIRLPDIDGYEVARRLANGSSAPAVVLVSTLDSIDVGGRAVANGARGFITKSKLSGDTLRRLLDEKEDEDA